MEPGNNIGSIILKNHDRNFVPLKDVKNKPTLGAHVYNSEVSGEKIIPACNSCNQWEKPFNIKIDTQFVSANKNETCEQ